MPLPHFPGSTYPLNCKEQGVSTKNGIDRVNDTHQPGLPIMPLQIKVPKEIRLDMIFWHHLFRFSTPSYSGSFLTSSFAILLSVLVLAIPTETGIVKLNKVRPNKQTSTLAYRKER